MRVCVVSGDSFATVAFSPLVTAEAVALLSPEAKTNEFDALAFHTGSGDE